MDGREPRKSKFKKINPVTIDSLKFREISKTVSYRLKLPNQKTQCQIKIIKLLKTSKSLFKGCLRKRSSIRALMKASPMKNTWQSSSANSKNFMARS
jgi:hypothetical protein